MLAVTETNAVIALKIASAAMVMHSWSSESLLSRKYTMDENTTSAMAAQLASHLASSSKARNSLLAH